jgi:hypothetical protein
MSSVSTKSVITNEKTATSRPEDEDVDVANDADEEDPFNARSKVLNISHYPWCNSCPTPKELKVDGRFLGFDFVAAAKLRNVDIAGIEVLDAALLENVAAYWAMGKDIPVGPEVLHKPSALGPAAFGPVISVARVRLRKEDALWFDKVLPTVRQHWLKQFRANGDPSTQVVDLAKVRAMFPGTAFAFIQNDMLVVRMPKSPASDHPTFKQHREYYAAFLRVLRLE